jgi:alpha-L-rhamnosidase
MTREYDVLPLGEMQPGDHLIAVLSQWAPNIRRSESVTPFLQARVQGLAEGSLHIVAHTDATWKALLADAWREDAALVHTSELIGPTELVDLRQIPSDWMSPGYSDDGWLMAVVKDVPEAVYQPRSIPLLENVPITPTVTDAGLLSPGRELGELLPSVSSSYVFTFTVVTPTLFTVETLSETGLSLAGLVWLDGGQLAWEETGADRPDAYLASKPVVPGSHTLSIPAVPSQGLTFAISRQGILSNPLPFQQGAHAGRRLLLAEPVSQPDHVVISSSGAGVDLEFTTLPAYVVLDLDRVVHGRLVAEAGGPVGSVIDIGWDERLWLGARPLPYPGSLHDNRWNQTDSWVLDGTARKISTLDARAGRYILLAVWGGGPVQLGNIRVYEERYPVTQRGAFHSSDPLLDRIWEVGVDTLYPNMTDAYTDTPWRERGQWWGDAFVEDQINQVAFGDTMLLRRGLLFMEEAFVDGRPLAAAPNGRYCGYMLDYGMLWVQSLGDYWRQTGDVTISVST